MNSSSRELSPSAGGVRRTMEDAMDWVDEEYERWLMQPCPRCHELNEWCDCGPADDAPSAGPAIRPVTGPGMTPEPGANQ